VRHEEEADQVGEGDHRQTVQRKRYQHHGEVATHEIWVGEGVHNAGSQRSRYLEQ